MSYLIIIAIVNQLVYVPWYATMRQVGLYPSASLQWPFSTSNKAKWQICLTTTKYNQAEKEEILATYDVQHKSKQLTPSSIIQSTH